MIGRRASLRTALDLKMNRLLLSVAWVFAGLLVVPAFAQEPASPWLPHLEKIDNWLDTMRFDQNGKVRYAIAAETPNQSSMDLYHGLPGILLFYHKMYQVTGEERYRIKSQELARVIAGHLDQEDGSGNPGLFTGYTGLAWVLLKTWPAEHRDSIEHCIECLSRSASKLDEQANEGERENLAVTWNEVNDVIGGSAGIGMFLLHCWTVPEIASAEARTLAIDAANGLILRGQPAGDSGGQKWMMDPSFPREMPNYSHGTAGVCDFLIEIHKKCAIESAKYDGRFGDAALAGAKYLLELDTRHGANGLLPHHFPDGEKLFYLGWCHGPPGTCQLANRVAEIKGLDAWRDYSDAATTELVQSALHRNRTDGFWNNTGICCGSAGVGSFLLDQSIKYRNDKYRAEAQRIALDILSRSTIGESVDGRETLCWTSAEHRVQPDFLQTQTGLMQGAAGVGLFLLQLEAARSEEYPFSIFGDLMSSGTQVFSKD